MHKYIILFFSVLLILTACNTDKVPQGVIDKPQMISLLTDMHIIDGTLYNVPQDRDSLYKYGHAKYIALFKRHKTNDKVFRKSFEYYTTQPELIQDMYTQIEANIKAKTDSITKVGTKKYKNALPKK
jgi:hypothetical protein